MGGTLTKNNYSTLLFTGVIIAITMFISMIPTTHDYNPLTLTSANAGLMPTIMTTLLLIIIVIGSSILVFRKKQL